MISILLGLGATALGVWAFMAWPAGHWTLLKFCFLPCLIGAGLIAISAGLSSFKK